MSISHQKRRCKLNLCCQMRFDGAEFRERKKARVCTSRKCNEVDVLQRCLLKSNLNLTAHFACFFFIFFYFLALTAKLCHFFFFFCGTVFSLLKCAPQGARLLVSHRAAFLLCCRWTHRVVFLTIGPRCDFSLNIGPADKQRMRNQSNRSKRRELWMTVIKMDFARSH